MSRHEIGARIAGLRESIPAVVRELSEEQMEKEYPEVVLEVATTTRQFLIHLYGHPELASRPDRLSAPHL